MAKYGEHPKKPGSIYAIRCDVNGKMYIGYSADPEKRAAQHFAAIRNDRYYACGTPDFAKDVRQYGQEQFTLHVLEADVPPEKLRDRDAYWTKVYKTTNPEYGYNICKLVSRPLVNRAEGLPPKPGRKGAAGWTA